MKKDCCNCREQRRLMKHPHNKIIGNGTIKEQLGYVCLLEYADGSNKGEAIFYETKHGMCELWRKNV